ncbi:MAG: DEAD/DEAH box helicase [Bacteroidales bacterium]|nr:DEAD/DEAH box helicase [Bacteroidales bacterium]
MSSFQDLELKPEILEGISLLGYEQPTPIQELVIPYMLNESNDLVALAQTGTGKTAAFGLPLLNMLNTKEHKIQALILSPTRELCMQIANDLRNYASQLREIKVVAVYGGENIVSQFKQLDVQPQVLVATPGRLIDLITRDKVHLEQVSYLVLDEADEMLNMGFQEDLDIILAQLPTERRTLLFSATMPKEIQNIAHRYMRTPKEISVGQRNAGAENIEHIYYMVQASNRYLALKRIIDINPNIYGIVFCRTRQETQEVAEKLMRDGYNADALHGDLSQAQRDNVMNKFRIHHLQILVATDVAARGLDVSDLTHVINYNLPDDTEIYTHRSGRTGRANKKGVSISIIHQRERRRINEIERMVKKTFTQQRVPDGMEVCKKQLFSLIDKMEKATVNEEEIEPFMKEITSKLSYLSKEDMLKKFVSLEFNRFADYYRNAPDLNLPDHKESKGKDNNPTKGQRIRFKLNLGRKHNATVRDILGCINRVTNDKSISILNVDIDTKFTFFDVYADQADQLEEAFGNDGGRLSVERLKNQKTPPRHHRDTKTTKGKTSKETSDKRKGKNTDNNKSRRNKK